MAAADLGGEEKPPNEGVVLFPLLRPPKPLKPPAFPNPEKAVGVVEGVVIEKPLNPLKAPPPSLWKPNRTVSSTAALNGGESEVPALPLLLCFYVLPSLSLDSSTHPHLQVKKSPPDWGKHITGQLTSPPFTENTISTLVWTHLLSLFLLIPVPVCQLFVSDPLRHHTFSVPNKNICISEQQLEGDSFKKASGINSSSTYSALQKAAQMAV